MYGMYDMVADLLSNRNQTATQVYVHCQVDLFSEVGEAWMRDTSETLPRHFLVHRLARLGCEPSARRCRAQT